MRKLLFIYNPKAGQAQISNHIHTLVDVFVKAGYLVTIYPTQQSGDAGCIAQELGAEYDRVVCSGGDGTLHEVIGGLMALEQPPVVGYVPLGSTNDFAKNLHLPRSIRDKALAAVGDNLFEIDIGRFQDRNFIYVAAFGMFTEVAYNTPQEFKNVFGHLAYLFAGVGSLANIKSEHVIVEHDHGVIEGNYIYGMVGNSMSVGGFQTLKEDDMDLGDGLFEVMLLKMPENLAQWQGVLHQLATQEPDATGAITIFHTSKVRFLSQTPIAWTLDGEFGGELTLAEVENIKHGLIMAAGKNMPRRLELPSQSEASELESEQSCE